MCCRNEAEFVSSQKALSIAVRRTSRLPTGDPLTSRQVAQLSYYELATGRSRHVTDWAAEVRDRCTKPMYLKLPFDSNPPSKFTYDMYLVELKDVLVTVLQPLSKKIDTSTTSL